MEISQNSIRKVQSQVKKYLEYWVPRLRLQEFQFTLKIETDIEKLDGCFGFITQSKEYRKADITIAHPDLLDELIKHHWCSRDLEVTLVHELLHARFLFANSRTHSAQPHVEMALETVAVALVSEHRQIKPEELS